MKCFSGVALVASLATALAILALFSVRSVIDSGDSRGQPSPKHARLEQAKVALEKTEQLHGPNGITTAAHLDKVAYLYKLDEEYAKAETLYRRALEIRKEALIKRFLTIVEESKGPNYPSTTEVLQTLTTLYQSMGREEEAQQVKERMARPSVTQQ